MDVRAGSVRYRRLHRGARATVPPHTLEERSRRRCSGTGHRAASAVFEPERDPERGRRMVVRRTHSERRAPRGLRLEPPRIPVSRSCRRHGAANGGSGKRASPDEGARERLQSSLYRRRQRSTSTPSSRTAYESSPAPRASGLCGRSLFCCCRLLCAEPLERRGVAGGKEAVPGRFGGRTEPARRRALPCGAPVFRRVLA